MISLLLLTFNGISQTNIKDSVTCLPNIVLRKAIKDIEAGKITAEKLAATEKMVSFISQRLSVKDSIINLYQKKESVWTSIDSSYKKTISNFERSEVLRTELIESLYLNIKSEKRKKNFYKILSGTFAGTIVYMGVRFLILK